MKTKHGASIWYGLLICILILNLPLVARAADVPETTTYQIRNAKYLDLLRPRDANNANGTPIVLYPAQPWKCMTWRLRLVGKSTFQLKNLFTSKTIAAKVETNALERFVTQVPLPHDADEPVAWQFVKLADGHYEIIEPKTGQALTARKISGEYEAKIIVAPWQNEDAQKWIMEKIDPKELTI